jgi:large subunit ribosomal protein L3
MTALYDAETGVRTPCTVLQLDRCQVVSHKTKQKHGYYAVQVGCGWRHPSNITRPMLGHYATNKVSPKKELVEFRVRGSEGLPPVGIELKASWFVVGQYVDAKSQNRGMGFAGVCILQERDLAREELTMLSIGHEKARVERSASESR